MPFSKFCKKELIIGLCSNVSVCTLVNVYVDLSIRHAHGDLCKHLGIDSSTDLDDRYSNLFLNAYINRHVQTEYLKII